MNQPTIIASDEAFLIHMNQEAMFAFARPATDAELDAAMNAHDDTEDVVKKICPDCRKVIRNGCGHSESCDYGAEYCPHGFPPADGCFECLGR